MNKVSEKLYWSKVDRSGGPSACHPWLGHIDQDGYGKFGNFPKGAHRIALEFKLGRPIVSGKMALHTCDNRPCCNAEHLYEGTAAQNSADCVARGRQASRANGRLFIANGTLNGLSKLTDDAVRAIRAAPGTRRQIAARFGISAVTVTRIVNRQMWKHI